jgi:hypothetical protein
MALFATGCGGEWFEAVGDASGIAERAELRVAGKGRCGKRQFRSLLKLAG